MFITASTWETFKHTGYKPGLWERVEGMTEWYVGVIKIVYLRLSYLTFIYFNVS